MLKNLKASKTARLWLVITAFYMFFGAVSIITQNIHFDEEVFHLPTLETFYNENPIAAIVCPDYKSASTPLPYLIVSSIIKVFNLPPILLTTRLANILISILSLFIFLQLIKTKATKLLYPALILFFYPYFLKPSFAFFMAIYGLLFFLLFIYYADRTGGLNNFLSGLFLACAILSQQFYLVVFFFYVIFLLYNNFLAEKNVKHVKEVLLFSVPLILPLLLFYHWGGLTHHNFRAHSTEFLITNITSVLVILGSALFPFLIFSLTRLTKVQAAAALVFSLILIIFAFPIWVNAPVSGGTSGYTFHSIAIINGYSSIASFIVKVSLCFLGITSFIILYTLKKDSETIFIYYLFIFFAFGFAMNILQSERHMLPLVVLGYLLIFSSDAKLSMLRFWLGIQVIIGSAYFYYIMFVYISS